MTDWSFNKYKTMGNQSSMEGAPQPPVSSSSTSAAATAEPLESYMREQQRDEHLKNLGFKRNKSLRRSISKRLRRVRKKDGDDSVDHGDKDRDKTMSPNASTCSAPPAATSTPTSAATVERLPEPAQATKRKRPLVGDQPQPFPTHVQQV